MRRNRRVIIESPFRGKSPQEATANRVYLNACIRDCIMRGESPYASHQMLTTALDDEDEAERRAGIEAGFAWWTTAHEIVFYVDRGWSPGMVEALQRVNLQRTLGNLVAYSIRELGGDW